jgi:tRNA A58 N-methylase Trm61
MTSANRSDVTYVLGRSEEETRRLERQSQFLYPFTRRFFEEAGVTAGMNVLDVGSGAGGPGIPSVRPGDPMGL